MASEKKITPKLIALGLTGHCMEWFDFSIYASLSTVLAELFFPKYSPNAALLASLSVFAIGFMARPLGAILLGYMGDKVGRKRILILSMFLMTLSTVGMGLLPTYAQIGVWAPILLMILRIIQGFSVSGETGTSLVYFIEQTSIKNKFFMGSLVTMGYSVGYMLASLVTVFLTKTLSTEDFYQWGWRIPFLSGIILGVFALYLRFKLQESTPFLEAQYMKQLAKNPLMDVIKSAKREMGYVMMFVSFATVCYYMIVAYLYIYMQKVGGMNLGDALSIISIAVLVKIIILPIIGCLVDKYIGFKPAMLLGAASCFFYAPFLFKTLAEGNPQSSLIAILIFTFLANLYQAPCPGLVGGMFNVKTRTTGVAIGWNFVVALFGGTTPLVAALLLEWTGNPISPAYYVSAIAAMSFVAVIFYRGK